MMLPLEKRNNRLLSIHLRIISLDYAKYQLQIEAANGKIFLSNETEMAMLPKFDLDRNNKELSKFLLNTTETYMKFVLIKARARLNECCDSNADTNSPDSNLYLSRSPDSLEKIVEFSVDMGELIYFCEDMSKARIKNYPIIIFEFTEGFYTTRDLYVNNTYNYQLEAFNILNINSAMNSFNLKIKGNMQGQGPNNSFIRGENQFYNQGNSLVFQDSNFNNYTLNSAVQGSNFNHGRREENTLKTENIQERTGQFSQNNISASKDSFSNISNTNLNVLKNESSISFNNNLKESQIFSSTNNKKTSPGFLSSKKEIKFSILNEKIKQYEFFDKQLKIITGDKSEKIYSLNSQITIAHDAFRKYYKKYEMTINIDKLRKQIYGLQEKIMNYEISIDTLKKIISQKQSDLHISSSIFSINKENYKEKVQNVEKNYKKIEKYKIMKNSFKNKKLIEVGHFFFNKLCYKFYLVPSFYNQIFDNVNKVLRYQYYEKNIKELAVMMGNVSNLVNYLSKLFNIPLKYPLFINGSRSFIVKDKKDFVALYSIPKNEDRNQKFELAMSYLQDNLNEVIKYFQIKRDEDTCMPFGENPFSISYTYHLSKRNLFSEFVKLNSYLISMVTKNKLFEDL